MEPATIAAQLRELSIYYELEGDRHRSFAYQRAANSIEAANGLHRLVEEGRLEELPGIGPSIARVIGELYRRGNVTVLEKLRATWPAVVVELARLPRVGAAKARTIWNALAPADLEAVAAACRAGAVAELPGFGKTSAQRLLSAIETRHALGVRALLVDAEDHAASIARYLRALPAAIHVEIAGPVRRAIEIVDHLAFAVLADDPAAVAADIARMPLLSRVAATDPALITATMTSGLRVEVRIATRASFGWAWIAATGSVDHVDQLIARGRELGVTPTGSDEAACYRALGLPWLPPEVRDGSDEIAAALAGDAFTDLITLDQLITATHCHTTHSDGKHSILEMARAAGELGYRAITITDHSAAASYASGLDLEKLRAQASELDELTGELAALDVRALRGTEADILADGAIDVPSEWIGKLDLVIASVHQRYKLDRAAATARLVTAMRQPFFKIWGHALGRLVLRRDPIAVDVDAVLDAAAESGAAAIEINGDPYRLDLDPVNARKAAARGLRFVLSCDAHSINGLSATRYAVAMARRARVRTRDVLNALPVDDMLAIVRPRIV